MMRLNLVYILLTLALLSFTGCESQDNIPVDTGQSDQSKVFLSITKAQAAGLETFNADDIDFEDRVHDLAMLVFDASSGVKVCEFFDEGIPFSEKDKTFIVEMLPGQRNFVFVANMPMSVLKGITTMSDMEVYLSTLRNLDIDLYLKATATKGFPMSRIYKNQTISHGGNIYSPQPFRPINESGVEEDGVKLVRVVAKLEVKLDGLANQIGVKNIYYHNAYRQFSLNALAAPSSVAYYEDKLLKKIDNTSYIYYMPEALMVSPVWASGDRKPINYFVIETLNGTSYEIPIITYDGVIADGNYLAFATGSQTTKPDYNIYRNRHYYFTIKNLKNIEVIYNIDPWTLKQSATYMGYGYNVGVDETGKVIIGNTIEACAPHAIKLQTVSPFTFSDGTTEKSFTSLITTATAEYMLNTVPLVGNGTYLQVYYNDVLVKTFSK